MHKQKRSLVIVGLVLAHVAWGINTPAIKMAVESMPVTLFLALRYLLIALVLLPLAIKYWQPIARKDLLRQAAVAACFATNVFLLGYALTKTTSISAAAIDMLNPLIMLLLAAVFLGNRISRKSLIGVAAAFCGSLILIGRVWEINGSNEQLIGDLLLIIGVTCSVTGVILFKPLAQHYNPFQTTLIGLSLGNIPAITYAVSHVDSTTFSQITDRSLYGLILSAVSMLTANILFFYALRARNIAQISYYYYIQPAAVILAAWFLLAERPTISYVVGFAFIIVGVFIAEKNSVATPLKPSLRRG